jgi:hypothetical protein
MAMADSAHITTSTVVPLPRTKLEQRRDREILLALIDEHQKWIAKHSQAITSRNARIGELLADLRDLDGYRTHDWEVDWPWAS